ncbi:MAG: ATP-dependent DNA helicase RecG [Phycisphaerae bacterium]|nr:ATP-dependent DNA helicase RecG [Phycisphaerae bacterium]
MSGQSSSVFFLPPRGAPAAITLHHFMQPFQLDTSLQYVKGVGPQRAELFAALGIRTVADLLNHLPFRYEDSLGEVPIVQLEPETNATIRGTITEIRARFPGLRVVVHDGTGECTLRWFQRRAGGHGLNVGATVIATGDVREFDFKLEMVQPTVQIFLPESPGPAGRARPMKIPVYPASERLPSVAIQRVVQTVLARGVPHMPDPLPPALLRQHSFPPRDAAVQHVHQPKDDEQLSTARRRLAYEELLLLAMALQFRRRRVVRADAVQPVEITPTLNDRIRARFPFPLTAAQDAVTADIARDLASGHPMTRLLQGDVGSGKTVVALYAALAVVARGGQVAFLAPTELLAQQHFRTVKQYLAGSRVQVALLSGALTKKERDWTLHVAETGELQLVIGTQALVQKHVRFRKLALVIVDEQHRFGVMQRANIRTKGPMPHLLAMTATPIPRTLALTIFGDLDISTMRGKPPGRGRIRTTLTPAGALRDLLAKIRARLEAGEQAYVVCPALGQDPESPAKAASHAPPVDGADPPNPPNSSAPSQRSPRNRQPGAMGAKLKTADGANPAPPIGARETFERLRTGPWSGLRLALLYGDMAPAEKDLTIRAFDRGELDAIIATTVVEVGVNVPSASIMLILEAERFGLAQLHQLRGRVGRGERDGDCYLAARTRNRDSLSRLEALVRTDDGFKIAEEDLKHRGPGDFLGTRQHGLPMLQVADIVNDLSLFEVARSDAETLLAADPRLIAPDHAPLRAALKRWAGEKLSLIDAG